MDRSVRTGSLPAVATNDDEGWRWDEEDEKKMRRRRRRDVDEVVQSMSL